MAKYKKVKVEEMEEVHGTIVDDEHPEGYNVTSYMISTGEEQDEYQSAFWFNEDNTYAFIKK